MAFAERKNLPADFTITYHAGFCGTPENTVEGLKAAVENGARVAEIDVTFRENGTPVMAHLDSAGENEGELLSDGLAVIAATDNVRINLDLKSTMNMFAVDALVKIYGLEGRAFYTGVFADWVDRVRAGSSLPYYINHNLTAEETASTASIEAVAQQIKGLGGCGLNTCYDNVNSDVIRIMHSNSLPVSVWTCNDEESMKKMLATAPDNITTKRPDILKTLINW